MDKPTDKLADRPVVKNKHAVRLKTVQAQPSGQKPSEHKPSGQKPPDIAHIARKAAPQEAPNQAAQDALKQVVQDAPKQAPKQTLNQAPKQAPRPKAGTKVGTKAGTKVGTSSFWSDLFLVRPWLLVGGLWLTFIVLISVSWAGLSSPGREMVLAPVSSSIDGQPLSAPDAAAAARLVLPDEDKIVLTQRDPAATLPGAPEQAMPAWPLLVMVAACAGGCMLMSNQGLLTAEPRRARRRGLDTPVAHRSVRSTGSRPTGSRPTGSRPTGSRPTGSRPTGRRNRRSKHRRIGPQRPLSQVMAFQSGQKKIHHTPPLQNASRSGVKPVSFAVGHGAATPVTVVPENETSALDWKEGSLAHRLDVRQTRSINSFL